MAKDYAREIARAVILVGLGGRYLIPCRLLLREAHMSGTMCEKRVYILTAGTNERLLRRGRQVEGSYLLIAVVDFLLVGGPELPSGVRLTLLWCLDYFIFFQTGHFPHFFFPPGSVFVCHVVLFDSSSSSSIFFFECFSLALI